LGAVGNGGRGGPGATRVFRIASQNKKRGRTPGGVHKQYINAADRARRQVLPRENDATLAPVDLAAPRKQLLPARLVT
jgi:hypothetical protein